MKMTDIWDVAPYSFVEVR